MPKNFQKYVSIFVSFDLGVKFDSDMFWTFVIANNQLSRLWQN